MNKKKSLIRIRDKIFLSPTKDERVLVVVLFLIIYTGLYKYSRVEEGDWPLSAFLIGMVFSRYIARLVSIIKKYLRKNSKKTL